MDLLEDESQWKQFLRNHGYLLHHQIGYGSFGDVFCVTMISDNAASMKYALKRLVTRRNILDDGYVMMEIHSLLQLQHQNIVSLHEVFLTKNVACIVMELAPLGNLEMLLKNSGTPKTKGFVMQSFAQILSAVDYCHGLSLAHRDINPTNVLVCSLSLVKIADFGLCFQCRDEATGNSLLCADYLGQEKYSAPEVKRCEPFHAMPADIWSSGCLLSYLATNSHCFYFAQSACDNQFNEKHSENLEIENNTTVTVSADFNSNFKYEQCENSCRGKVEATDGILINGFIQKLCRHSPKERPSIKEASLCWKDISCAVNSVKTNDNANDNPRVTRNREE